MDFFDMVPDNFFSLLSSKNKRIYLASIIEVFKVYETGSILGIDKKIVVDDLIYFLDVNSNLLYDSEDEEDEESNPQSKRELANYILRKMEECGWIYVDVNNDYVEVLNFSDTAITLCEALMKAYPSFEYDDGELPADYVNPNEYQGYIYQIYSILNQPDIVDYSLTFSLVYSNTKQLVRAIRRLDARMKEYIASVIENTEIKDLMERLVSYKNDIYDASYMKLKVGDNIDRYRLSIVTKLENMQEDEMIVSAIAKNYVYCSKTEGEAISKAIKNIDEVIDAFNAIEGFIAEIDNKNRNYINSTIGKIKFLLSEDDNVVGKLNSILRYIKTANQKNKLDKAIRLIEGLYSIRVQKILDSESSLYTPRGSYSRNYNQVLDEFDFDFDLNPEFLSQFKNSYNEEEIANFIEAYMVDGVFQASKILDYEADDHTFLMVIYSVILAVEKLYTIVICEDYINHKVYRMKDFLIMKGDK